MRNLSYFLIFMIMQTTVKGNDKSSFLPNNENVATLVIYVKRNFNISSFGLLINDNKVINSFSRNRYYVIKHSPGKINLKTKAMFQRISSEDKAYSLTLEAGETYYLEAMMEYQVLMNSVHLIKRSSEHGQNEISTMMGELITLD